MFSWGESLSFFLGVLAYLAAMVLFFLQILQRKGPIQQAPMLLGVGAIAHFFYLIWVSVVAHVCPVESVNFALSVTSLVTSASYLLARRRWPLDVLGVVVAPLGLIPLLGTKLAALHDTAQRVPPVFLTLHVAANLLGIALFSLACTTAVFYLFVERRLKQKRFASVMGRLPPLDSLDQAGHRFLLTGFPLLTLGIITGTVWSHQLHIGMTSEFWRAALSLVMWLVFGGVLLLRVAAGWRGRRAALGTIAGFILALLVLVGYLVRPVVQADSLAYSRVEVHV